VGEGGFCGKQEGVFVCTKITVSGERGVGKGLDKGFGKRL